MSKTEFKERGIENERENRRNFRVAIFGTGRESSKQDEEVMNNARLVAGLAIEQGFSIATGGYDKGSMRSASEAAVKKAKELGIENTNEVVKAYVFDEKFGEDTVKEAEIIHSNTLIERLQNLIDKSDAFIVLGGKTGTVVELIAALHSEKIKKKMQEKGSAGRPIIIIDPSMEHTDLLGLLAKKDKKFKSDKTLNEIYILSHAADIQDQVKEILDLYYKESQGEKISEEERLKLDQLSFKKFLDSQEHFAAGAGI